MCVCVCGWFVCLSQSTAWMDGMSWKLKENNSNHDTIHSLIHTKQRWLYSGQTNVYTALNSSRLCNCAADDDWIKTSTDCVCSCFSLSFIHRTQRLITAYHFPIFENENESRRRRRKLYAQIRVFFYCRLGAGKRSMVEYNARVFVLFRLCRLYACSC